MHLPSPGKDTAQKMPPAKLSGVTSSMWLPYAYAILEVTPFNLAGHTVQQAEAWGPWSSPKEKKHLPFAKHAFQRKANVDPGAFLVWLTEG